MASEHLLWAFERSTGAIVLPCRTPENLLERVKKFLYDNRETPHGFRNLLLGEIPPPFRFPTFHDAKAALNNEVSRFGEHFHREPGASHEHPIFRPLGSDEWHRSHYKHCYHHLMQFGLLS